MIKTTKKFNKGIFAKIDKQFLMRENKWFMKDPDLLYIFTILSLSERKDGVARINYHTIDSLMVEKFNKVRTRNNEKIAHIIQKLSNQGFLEFSHLPDQKEYYEFFYVKIFYEDWQGENADGKWRGFEKIGLDEFLKTEKIKYFYIYSIVKTNQGTGQGFKCSFDMWHERTNFSVSMVKRYINHMIHKDKGILFMRRGDFIGESRKMQEVNIYRTYDFTEEERSNRDRNHDLEKKDKRNKFKKPTFDNNTLKLEEDNPF